jgi:hypothetical protein
MIRYFFTFAKVKKYWQHNMENQDRLFANKSKYSFTPSMNQAFRLMSIDLDNSSLVGSLSFEYPLYPSDIDMREVVGENMSLNEVVNFFKDEIRKKVIRIAGTKNFFVMEVKIGIDPASGEPLRWQVPDIINGVKLGIFS